MPTHRTRTRHQPFLRPGAERKIPAARFAALLPCIAALTLLLGGFSVSANSISPAKPATAEEKQAPAGGKEKGSQAAIARDVFLVVDVSGSVTQSRDPAERASLTKMIDEGKRLSITLVSGTFKAEDFPDWKWSEQLLVSPLREIVAPGNTTHQMSGPGKRAVIIPFADKAVDHESVISPPFQTFPSDFEDFVGKEYPSVYRDQHTYVTLARSRTAEVAESLQIRQYYFLMITDAVQDPKAAYSLEETKLLNRWDSENFVASKTRIGLFEYKGEGLESRNYQIDVWKVDLDLPPASARIITSTPVQGQTIAPGELAVEWDIATGAADGHSRPPGYTYFLSLLDADSGALLQSLSVKDSHSATMPVTTAGNYRLTISGNRQEGAADSTLPEVLGQSEVQFSAAEPGPAPPASAASAPDILELGLAFSPLFAGEESTIRWRLDRKGSTEAAPVSGEFEVTITNETSQAEVVSKRTRTPEISHRFLDAGGYRLKINLHPDEKLPLIEFGEQVIQVNERRTPKPEPEKPAAKADPALEFVLPRSNSTIKPGKVLFRWSVPPTTTPIKQYRLRVSGPERFEQTTPTPGFARVLKKPGRYTAQLSVVAPPDAAQAIKSAQLAFTVKGGGGGIWLLLLVVLGAGAGYYFWKQKQTKPKSKKAANTRS